MKKCLLLLCLFGTALPALCREWLIADKVLTLRFNDASGRLTITDKRCNKTWQQLNVAEGCTLQKVVQSVSGLQLRYTGRYTFAATILLTAASEVEYTVSAASGMAINDLKYPGIIASPKDHFMIMTDGEGLLLPVADQAYPLGTGYTYNCGGGLAMAWMGVTDKQYETGYMALLQTPYDAALQPLRTNGVISFQPLWRASLGRFGYDRKITYVFFAKGGYVAQCKRYRNFIWPKNNIITLKEKEARFPAIAKIIGAVHLYVWADAREVSFAKELKASGIDKAFVLWNPNHVPYPEKDYYNRLKELGYASGVYELTTDLKLKDTGFYAVDTDGPLRFARTTYPGLFNSLAMRNKEGKTYFNQFGHTACPVAIRPQIVKRVDRELKEYPHEAYFLDVYQANGLFECYSPQHPLTRQGFAEAATANFKLMEDKYNQFAGGEWGSEFTGSSSVFNHGMMTLHRTWWGTNINQKGTIYYTGDWRNNSRPTQMVGSRVANETYLKYSINEYSRVPLFELVYHDAMVNSWRWEDANHHAPEIWWKKDLFNVLYGTVPLWSLDRPRWEAYRQTFIDSYKTICPWLQQIGYDELVSHRFISADHKVQGSTFSSGKSVVVNFGDDEATFNGIAIPPRSFRSFTN